MKTLITGATGFIGSHLLRHVVAEGASVAVLVRPRSDTAMIADLLPHIELRYGDVTDKESVCRAMKGVSQVYHSAGRVSISSRGVASLHRINVEGTKHVLQAAAEHGVRRVVYTSSVSAIGITGTDVPANETQAWNLGRFNVPYYHTKHLAEEAVREAVGRGLDAVIVNPSYVFGAGDVHFNAGGLVRDLHHRRIPAYPTGGVCVADIDDVAKAHIAAMRLGKSGERYIVGGENLSYKQVFDTICGVIAAPKVWLPISQVMQRMLALLAKSQLFGITALANPEILTTTRERFYFDSSKAVGELGLTHTPFAETIRRTFEWYRHRKLL